jgi:hypothetical protein
MSGDGSFDDPFEPWEAIEFEYRQTHSRGVVTPWWHRDCSSSMRGFWRPAVSKAKRKARRDALSTIFEILGAETFHQRLLAIHIIMSAISEYRRNRDLKGSAREAWCRKIARHAKALAALADADPEAFGSVVLAEDGYRDARRASDALRRWAWRASHYGLLDEGWRPPPWVSEADIEQQADHPLAWRYWRGLSPQEPRRKGRDWPVYQLISALEPLYADATGRAPSRSESRGRSAERDDPFVQFLGAVWRLAGEVRGRDGVVHQVRNWRADRVAMEVDLATSVGVSVAE